MIYTPVTPMNAIEHPIIAYLYIFFFKNIDENIAVVIITPPREICHTLLATIFSAKYDSKDDNRSKRVGISINKVGALFFINP